ncbi:RNA-binding protein 45 [Exaiptasia diaphana]|nr:RNA-binding protein 45 [Exaiptasia diaphana]
MASNNQGNDSGSNSGRIDVDNPPFSRVFVVCSKRHTSDDMRIAFEPYGVIEDIWMVKDKVTKENRGVCYIKFEKASSAALACEEMDCKQIGDDPKVIKAMIAQSKHSGSKMDFHDPTTMTRLFVICPKDYTDDDLRSKFENFGDLEYVQIVRDHQTRENKGYGYVKFSKASTASLALENCDKGLKAVWAEPKSAKVARYAAAASSVAQAYAPQNPFLDQTGIFSAAIPQAQPTLHQPMEFFTSQTASNPTASVAETITSSHTPTRLFVIVSVSLTQDQVARLFDIIPGMQMCDLKRNHKTGESKGFAYVTYNSVGSAIYAKEKLNGFEYPPGSKLVIKYAEDPPSSRNNSESSSSNNIFGSKSSIPGASTAFTLDSSQVYTTAGLPAPAPLADPNSEVVSRLFIVCNPAPPPDPVLKDVFSRFGNLIDVYMMKDRNFGYAKFASKDSADVAIEGLHGHEVLGMKLKVMHADPPKHESSRKRPRT